MKKRKQKTIQIGTTYEIQEEIQCVVSEKYAKKHTFGASKQMILALRDQGKELIPVLLKNNTTTYIIQSPAIDLFEKKEIDAKTLMSASRYVRDHAVRMGAGYARQNMDNGVRVSSQDKDLMQERVEAGARITFVELAIERASISFENDRAINKKYLPMINDFLLHDVSMVSLQKRYGGRKETIKNRILNTLDIIAAYYKSRKK